MNKIRRSVGIALLVLALALYFPPNIPATGYTVTELWSDPMPVTDVAVSKDGNYVVAVNSTGLYYFSKNSSITLWWYYTQYYDTFWSVAISKDGNYVAVGSDSIYGYSRLFYFNESSTRTDDQTGKETWTSSYIPGRLDSQRLVDMSDDGNYVVAGIWITSVNVTYFADCTTRRSGTEDATWYNYTGLLFGIRAVDISPDGRCVAAGGSVSLRGWVAFFNNSDVSSGPRLASWLALAPVDSPIQDVAVSDDGYAVAAASPGPGALNYWADSNKLPNDPLNTWNRTIPFLCVDMSSDGDMVVAGSEIINCVHFWDGARTLSGPDRPENWTSPEEEDIYDVGISDDGKIIAAVSPFGVGLGEIYFYTSSGALIDHFTRDPTLNVLSMSGDGSTVAVGGGGGGGGTLYVYGIKPLTPVGGELLIPDKLELMAPYLALAVLVVATAGILSGTGFRNIFFHAALT